MGCALLQYLGSLASLPLTKSGTTFGRGKVGNVTSAGWHVALCDPIWYVSSCSGKAGLLTKAKPLWLVNFYLLLLLQKIKNN